MNREQQRKLRELKKALPKMLAEKIRPYKFKKSVLDELNKNIIYPQSCGMEKFLLSNDFIYRYGAFIMKVYLKMKRVIRKFPK